MDTKDLQGKAALVTGGSRGIGRAVVHDIAARGGAVAVSYVSNEEAATETVDAITADGGRAVAVRGDVADVAAVAQIFDSAEHALGPLDFVVHAAATSLFKPHALIEEEEFDRLFALNVKGTFLVLGEAARRVRDGGRIVSFSTGGTQMALAAGGLYAASKAAGERMVASLAIELGERRVTVNSVAPGVTRTDGLTLDEATVDQLIRQTPLGRLGEPTDVANVVTFLLSDAGGWVNGQRINANGGIL